MQDFEKLGVFYLGRWYDHEAKRPKDELVLYESKDLVTHAVCVGMTGSGKTGLCISLLEEAAIDGIPALVIDPKGDLSNLLLTFPQLRGEDFAPWINSDEAKQKGLDPAAYAQQQAEFWKKGLADWGQDGARIQRLRDAADFAVYTPGSAAGIPISIMKSFAAPSEALREDTELFRERISTTGYEFARLAWHRRRPAAKPRTYLAFHPPRCRLASRQRRRLADADSAGTGSTRHQSRRPGFAVILPAKGTIHPGHAAQQLAGRTGFSVLDRRRSTGCCLAAVYASGQTESIDLLDRPSRRRRTNVLRDPAS